MEIGIKIMSKTKLIVIFIGLAAAAAVGFLIFRGTNPPREAASVVETEWEKRDKGETDRTIYENQAFGFSLEHPKEFKVSEFNDEKGLVILFEEAGGSRGFQIFVSEFDEPGPITVEKVRKDLPNLIMEEPQEVGLPAGSPPAGSSTSQSVRSLIFFSRDESLGRTREAWFIWPEDPKLSGNYLFQVTARAELDEELSKIMATLRFKN